MPGYLTTHVLDTARGCPAAGMKIDLYKVENGVRSHMHSMETNHDGRTNAPILPEGDFRFGTYELVFHAGTYLRDHFEAGAEPLFLDEIPIRFGMNRDDHYHVPLLLSPFGYSTYRGS